MMHVIPGTRREHF